MRDTTNNWLVFWTHAYTEMKCYGGMFGCRGTARNTKSFCGTYTQAKRKLGQVVVNKGSPSTTAIEKAKISTLQIRAEAHWQIFIAMYVTVHTQTPCSILVSPLSIVCMLEHAKRWVWSPFALGDISRSFQTRNDTGNQFHDWVFLSNPVLHPCPL